MVRKRLIRSVLHYVIYNGKEEVDTLRLSKLLQTSRSI